MKTAAHITKCAKVAPDVSPNSAGNHEASSASGQSSPFWSADGQPPACVYMIPQILPLGFNMSAAKLLFCGVDWKQHLHPVLFLSHFIGWSQTPLQLSPRNREGYRTGFDCMTNTF